jgi:hypothetical protein
LKYKFVIMQWTRCGRPDMTDQLARTLKEGLVVCTQEQTSKHYIHLHRAST